MTTHRILVVDDALVDRTKLVVAIKKQGHAVDAACDGSEALALMKENRYSLIFLDMIMPGMHGLDVLKAMADLPDVCSTPVVVVSSDDDENTRSSVEQAGIQGWLNKPFSASELAAQLALVSDAP